MSDKQRERFYPKIKIIKLWWHNITVVQKVIGSLYLLPKNTEKQF